jgi:hypothetical protein
LVYRTSLFWWKYRSEESSFSFPSIFERLSKQKTKIPQVGIHCP